MSKETQEERELNDLTEFLDTKPIHGSCQMRESVELPGAVRYSKNNCYHGFIAYGPEGHPVGLYVKPKSGHHKNVAWHFIPTSNMNAMSARTSEIVPESLK